MTAPCPLWLSPNPMRRIILFALVLFLTVTPCHALTFFQSDYDADTWTTERLDYGDWLPLRELSSILPYTVEWKDRTVYIYGERTWTIKPDRWMQEGVSILDGVTYVTPDYMRRFLPGISFLYEDELYVFNGEAERSRLVRGDEDFRQNALTALYRMKLAAPDTYDMIRRNLTGGVESVERPADIPLGELAYVYPSRIDTTAYIIGKPEETILARRIVHEAVHVEQYRNGRELDEDEAKKIETETVEKMLLMQKTWTSDIDNNVWDPDVYGWEIT